MIRRLILSLLFVPGVVLAMDTPITAGGTTLPNVAATNYGPISGNLLNWSTTDAAIRNKAGDIGACTIKNFLCRVATAPGVGTQWDFTLVQNGSDTGLICTIAGTNTTGSDTNAAHFVTSASYDKPAICNDSRRNNGDRSHRIPQSAGKCGR